MQNVRRISNKLHKQLNAHSPVCICWPCWSTRDRARPHRDYRCVLHEEKLASLYLAEKFSQVKVIPFAGYAKAKFSNDYKKKNKVAIIYADGEIIDGEGGEGIVGGATTADQIRRAREDMERAAKSLDFLAAARYRDRMYELQKIKEEAGK